MIDDTDLVARLRRELDEHRGSLAVPPGLMAAARDRSRRRRVRTALLAAALVTVVAGVGAAATLGSSDRAATVTAGPGASESAPRWRGPVPTPPPPPPTPPATTASTTFPTGPPSQTPEAAARDGVFPEVAALPVAARVQELARIEDGLEGTWVLSRANAVAIDLAGEDRVFGDGNGTYGVDFINPVEYGEVLLLGSGGPIVRAYPLPGLIPSWIHLTDQAVYAGRIGDGGLPFGSFVRIDRDTLEVQVIVFPAPTEGRPTVLPRPGWREATPEEAERYDTLVTDGSDATGTLVTTRGGVIGVDIDGVEDLFTGD